MDRREMTCAVLLLCLPVPWGCESGEVGSDPSGEVAVRDSAGVEIVETRPGWRDRTSRWSVEMIPEVLIPSESPREEYFLFDVVACPRFPYQGL